MWAPFVRESDAMDERIDLQRKLMEDKNSKVSVEISVDTILKLAELYDLEEVESFYSYCNLYDVERYINKILLAYVDEKTKEISKVKCKKK